MSVLTKITAAASDKGKGFSPDYFITHETHKVIAQYIRIKRHGLNSLYSEGDCPECMLQAFDIIQNELDRIQEEKFEKAQR